MDKREIKKKGTSTTQEDMGIAGMKKRKNGGNRMLSYRILGIALVGLMVGVMFGSFPITADGFQSLFFNSFKSENPELVEVEIVFVSDRDENKEIYVMDAEGKYQIRLTYNLFDEWDPAWSPDGSKIAFVSNRDGNAEIYVMNIDGSNVTRISQIGEATEPTWFPDGKKIAFAGSGPKYGGPSGAIFVVDVDEKNQKKLTEHTGFPCGGPAVSPDGKRIAYMFGTIKGSTLKILDVEGNLLHKFTFFFFGLSNSPSWSPEGKTMAFSAQPNDGISDNNGIYIVDVNSGSTQRLTEIGQNPSWSPNGKRIVFHNEGEIYVLEIESGKAKKITSSEGNNWDPMWGVPVKIPILVQDNTFTTPLPSPSPSLTPIPSPTPTLTPSPTSSKENSEKSEYIPFLQKVKNIISDVFDKIKMAWPWGSKVKEIRDSELDEIRSELDLSYPGDSGFIESDYYWITDEQLKEALNREMDPENAPGLTYGVYILNAIYEERLIESVLSQNYKIEASKFFNKFMDINTGWSSLASGISVKGLSGILREPTSTGMSSLFLALDAAKTGIGLKALKDLLFYNSLWLYFDERSGGSTHEEAWQVIDPRSPPTPQDYHVPTRDEKELNEVEKYFKNLWDVYGEHLSPDGGLNERFILQYRKELGAVLFSALEKTPTSEKSTPEPAPEGKYVHSVGKYGDEWIELKDNDVWRHGASWKDIISIGTWRQEGDQICFITAGEEDENEVCVAFTENTLIIEGEKLTKEEVAPAKIYNTNPVGRYKGEYGDYIEIKEDGICVVFVEHQYFTGTWEQKEQEGPKIKIQLTFREDGYEEKEYVILIENVLIIDGDMCIKEE